MARRSDPDNKKGGQVPSKHSGRLAKAFKIKGGVTPQAKHRAADDGAKRLLLFRWKKGGQ